MMNILSKRTFGASKSFSCATQCPRNILQRHGNIMTKMTKNDVVLTRSSRSLSEKHSTSTVAKSASKFTSNCIQMPTILQSNNQILMTLRGKGSRSFSTLRGYQSPAFHCKNTIQNIRHFSKQPWKVQNRRTNWGSNNPIFEGNNLIYTIIGMNVGVFFAWDYCKYDRYWLRILQNHFMVSSNGVTREYKVHTLLTAMFSHKDFWHLFSNMLTFYFFGQNVLSHLGASRLGVLYLGGGLVSSASQVLWPYFIPRDFPSRYRISKDSRALGASGAVAAVVTWSILKSPRQPILLFFVLPVPAGILGAGFLLSELMGLYQGSSNTGNAAHLGGAAFGALFFAAKK